MTSNISAIYDRIPVVLASLFPNKKRIPYPYELDRSNSRAMVDGYGFKIGTASFEELETCGFVVNRSISIVFTKQIFRLDGDVAPIDSILKSLLESVYTVQKSFYNYNELDIPDKIAKVDIGDVTEPIEVFADKETFLSMEASFIFWVYEKL
jgi:hypothetical protein